MPSKPRPLNLDKRQSFSGTVEVLANELSYLPTFEQRQLKASFWSRFNESPFCEPQEVQAGDVLQLIGDDRIDRWWAQPGFKEWFRNLEEFQESVQSAIFLAIDRLKIILSSSDPKMSSAQVQAAKLLFEVGRKMPPKHSSEKYVDEKIAKMDKKELEAYVQRGLRYLPGNRKNESLTPEGSADIMSETENPS